MNKNFEYEIKKELISINSEYEIGNILYKKSRECENIKDYIATLENIVNFLTKIKKNVELYLISCKETYEKYCKDKEKNLKSEKIINDPNYYISPIIGHGNIKVIKENNKLKIILECE